MKNLSRKIVAIILSTVLCVSIFTGCSSKQSTSAEGGDTAATTSQTTASAEGSEIVINYPSYRVGTHVNAPSEKKIVDSFNEEFKGKYKLVIEELPSDQAYLDKMKVLAASGDLPDIVEGKNGVRELAIANGQAKDLSPFIAKDQAFAEEIGKLALDAMTIDGKLYSISNSNFVVGYFYNKDMFKKAGIKPAATWDEWMSNLDALKSAGFTPLAFGTGENAWTVNLVLAALVGTTDAGNKFMNSNLPTNFNTPEMIDGLSKIQVMLKKYTTADAVGGLYANAANNFCQEKAAIIANGTWMTPDFSDTTKSPEGFADRVGIALFPKKGSIVNYDIGWMMCTKEPEKQEAVWTAIKWLTGVKAQTIRLEEGGFIPVGPKVTPSEELKRNNPLTSELIALMPEIAYPFKAFDHLVSQSVVDAFAKYYPDLAFEKMTPEEMVLKLNEAAEKAK